MQARNNSRLLLLLRIGAGLFLVLLIFLILATRIHLESGLNQVMLAVDYSDLRDISLYRGYLLDQLLDDLKSSGFTTLLIHEDTLASALVDGRIHQLPATSDFPTRLTTPDKQLASQLKQVFTLRFPATRCRQTTVADGTLTELSLAMDLTIQRTPSATVKSWPKIKHLGIGYPRTAIRLLQQKGFFLIPHYVVRSGENTGIIEHILDTAEWDQVELPLLISGTVLPSSDCIKNLVRARGVRPVEVEFGATIGWDSLKRSLKPGRFLKAHIISREIVANNHDRRIMFRLARAARERRVTILCPALRFRTHTDTDLWETNLDFLKNTRSMLREQNLHVSNELPSISMFLPLLFPVVFIPVVAMLLAAAPRPLALCGFLVVLVFSAFLLNGDVQPNQVIALWAALFFPVAAVVRFWPTEAQDHNPHTRPEILVRAVRAFLGATGFTLFGALVTASLLTTPDMLFGATLFRGVKLAYLLPPFLTAAVLFFRMDHPLRRVYRLFTERLTLIHLLIVLLVVTGTILYLTRSGNVPLLKPSNLERDIRDWLENIMVARPRTKEMLLGHPAFILGAALLARRSGRKYILLAMLAAIGQVSLFNTFCHVQSPLSLSILRSVNGLLIGIPFGLAIAWMALTFGWGKTKPRVLISGYFGMGNLGDDLVLAGEIIALRKADSGLDIEVLSGAPRKTAYKFDLDAVNRFNPLQVLAAIARANGVISGGGGLLQDVTGRFSSHYYLTLARMARILGKVDIHWGIGIGPFKNSATTRKAAWELAAADLVFLRDSSSINWIARPGLPPARVKTGGDLAFALAEVLPPPAPPSPQRPFILGLSVRSGNFFNSVKTDLIRSIASLLEESVDRVVLMPFDRNHDRGISEEIARELGVQASVPNNALTLEAAIETMDSMSLVIGMRLHSLILACLRGRPFIGLPYDPKVSSFIETLHLPEAGIALRNIDPKRLEGAAQTLLANRESAFHALIEASRFMGKTVLGNADRISKLIRSHWEDHSSQAL